MGIKYDTRKLEEKAKKKYGSIAAYSREYNKRYGTSTKTATANINGRYAPNPESMKNIADVLDIKFETVEECYLAKTGVRKAVKKVKPVKAVVVPVNPSDNTELKFNYSKLENAVEKSGMTKSKICSILNIAGNTFYAWKDGRQPRPNTLKRMCELLSIDVHDVFDRVEIKEEISEEKAIESPVSAPEPAAVFDMTGIKIPDGFKVFAPIDNLYDRMEIINDNLLLLAAMISGNQKPVIIQDSECQAANEPEEDTTEPEPVEEESPVNTVQKPRAIAPANKEIDRTITDNMSYEKYAAKIHNMVHTIATSKNDSFNDVMHYYYKELNKVYGVVYDQLKKEYSNDMGTTPKNTLKTVYHDKKIRQIFYNIIATDYSHVNA